MRRIPRKHQLRGLQLSCLVLGLLVISQLSGLRSPSLGSDMQLDEAGATLGDSSGGVETAKPSGGDRSRPGDGEDAVPLPPRLEGIAGSGIFGMKPRPRPPEKGRPKLLGLMGDYVVIQPPGGKAGLARAGEEFAGVLVIEIDTNRALIEYDGEREELTIFSGMGSQSLLKPEKEGSE